MFNQLVPVNRDRHAQKRVKQIDNYKFAQPFHIVSIMAHEFVRAAAIYPIVFIENRAEDTFRPVTLLGLEPGENVFVDAAGNWQASYIPAIVRRYPFALSKAGEEGVFTVCVDEGSPLVGDDEGMPLFDADGEPAEALENVKRYLGELQRMDAQTNAFCEFLVTHNMLTPLNVQLRQSDQVKNISGCFVINEERLNNLSDELFLEMRQRGYLPSTFAHLGSLVQMECLLKLREDKDSAAKGNAATALPEKDELPQQRTLN